ncbi:MAG: amino acid/amide transporter ATP-binding protein 1, family [Blastococcus sp.]|jgi:branched-chain amino acid transport system ATP-binding protein|nr:amino acid/amide transporter ATP-binding protein 1, family [Blastococcus sp.]
MSGPDASDASPPLVEVTGIAKHYGGVVAIEEVDLDIRQGETLGLIGPNGSGKTTLVNVLSGFVPPTAGALTIQGEAKRFLPPQKALVRYGFARTFQNIRLGRSMTAEENILVGMHHSFRPWSTVLPGGGPAERRARQTAEELLELVGIAHLRNRLAGQLSYGDQRRVEIARALATKPRLVMLDEPAAGMNPREAEGLIVLLQHIAKGRTLLLIEHNMSVVMQIADRVAVLDAGRRIALGLPRDVVDNPLVKEAYLGKRRAHVS